MPSEQTADPNAGQAPAPTETDALKEQLVHSLMGIIEAPDDQDVARASDELLRTLDARLAQEAAAA
jgi:hypothetical protein